LRQKRIQHIEDKKQDMKLADQWKGDIDIYQKELKINIEIYKPKKKNYYIFIPCKGNNVFSKCVFGPLTNVIKQEPLYTEYKKGKGEVPMKAPTYRVCVNYTTQGSHQGGPMNSYQEHFCMFSKNKTTIENLTAFLSKYSQKTTDKTKKKKRTKKKKGGGNKKSKSYITKQKYKEWEQSIINRYYNDEKKTTPIIPTNGNPSHLQQSKWILFLDFNDIMKQASSKKVKVADLPVKQKKSLYHIGTKKLDNVTFGYDNDDKEFKYPALDLGGNTVFRSKLKTSYETKFNLKLTKDTEPRDLSIKIYNEWTNLLGKTKIIGVTPKDIEKWLMSVNKLLKEEDYIILRFFQLPTKHRIVITQSDIRKLTGRYYERIYGLSDEEYAIESNNPDYYTMTESHFANPNITKQNLLNEHSSYDKNKKGGTAYRIPTSRNYKYCKKIRKITPKRTKECRQLCHSMTKKGYPYNNGSLRTCKKQRYKKNELIQNRTSYNKYIPENRVKSGGGINKLVYLENTKGKSNKFWSAELWMNKLSNQLRLFTSWGKLGTIGQSQTKKLGRQSHKKATELFNTLVTAKKKAGYQEKKWKPQLNP